MTRHTILLVALLALAVSACASGESSATRSEAAPTVEPTPEPTPEPIPEPAASDEADASAGAGGSDTALLDLLPDELNGQARIDVDLADNPMFAAALQGQGVDASEIEYTVSTYGTGAEAVGVTAMRLPGFGQTELEEMARLMTGMADGQGSAEVATVGGKQVLVMSAADVGQTAYLYFYDDAVFVIGGTSEEIAAELLAQLP